MALAETTAALKERVLSGGSRQLRVLAARGLLPLPPEDLIPLQVRLAGDPDPEVAGRAAAALKLIEPHLLADYLAAEAGDDELSWFAAAVSHPRVLEALIRRRDVPREVLVELAAEVDGGLQELLILRQDAIIEEPRILDALEANPQLDADVRRRIGEYRQHLLPREQATQAAEPLAELLAEEATEAEVTEAIAEVRKQPPGGERDESTELTEAQIRLLPVPVRLKLSRGAPRTLRGILLHDNNPQVARSTLLNNALSDDEVEQLARSRTVVDEVLEEIARQRAWMRKYPVLLALTANPRTPLRVARLLLPRLSIRDLRGLSANRNVSNEVRNLARQLYTVKMR